MPVKKDTDKQTKKEVVMEKDEVLSDEDVDEDINKNKKEKQKGKYAKRDEIVAAVAKVEEYVEKPLAQMSKLEIKLAKGRKEKKEADMKKAEEDERVRIEEYTYMYM